MANLRVTPELHQLLRATADHVGLDVSDVIRRTARWISKGRAVVRCDVEKMYYDKPAEVIRVRGFQMPAGYTPAEFRRLLACRCFEELQKPKVEPPTFPEVEGVDYIVLNEAEE